jgi:hypothetical protein
LSGGSNATFSFQQSDTWSKSIGDSGSFTRSISGVESTTLTQTGSSPGGVYTNATYNYADGSNETRIYQETTTKHNQGTTQSGDTWALTNQTTVTGSGASGLQTLSTNGQYAWTYNGQSHTSLATTLATATVSLPGMALALAPPDATTVPVGGIARGSGSPVPANAQTGTVGALAAWAIAQVQLAQQAIGQANVSIQVLVAPPEMTPEMPTSAVNYFTKYIDIAAAQVPSIVNAVRVVMATEAAQTAATADDWRHQVENYHHGLDQSLGPLDKVSGTQATIDFVLSIVEGVIGTWGEAAEIGHRVWIGDVSGAFEGMAAYVLGALSNATPLNLKITAERFVLTGLLYIQNGGHPPTDAQMAAAEVCFPALQHDLAIKQLLNNLAQQLDPQSAERGRASSVFLETVIITAVTLGLGEGAAVAEGEAAEAGGAGDALVRPPKPILDAVPVKPGEAGGPVATPAAQGVPFTNPNFVGPLTLEQEYARAVLSNRPWSWARDIPGGANLTAAQRAAIRQNALAQGLIPNVPYKPGTQFLDFQAAGLVQRVDTLPQNLWTASDAAQFRWLDARIPGGRPAGMTWHHSEIPGQMELVPFGPHNVTPHIGGRSPGMWADAPR